MTFDVSGVVSTINAVLVAGALVGSAAAAMRMGIVAWQWLTLGVSGRAERDAREQDAADARRHGY